MVVVEAFIRLALMTKWMEVKKTKKSTHQERMADNSPLTTTVTMWTGIHLVLLLTTRVKPVWTAESGLQIVESINPDCIANLQKLVSVICTRTNWIVSSALTPLFLPTLTPSGDAYQGCQGSANGMDDAGTGGVAQTEQAGVEEGQFVR